MRELNIVESLSISAGYSCYSAKNMKHDCISSAVFGGLLGFVFSAPCGEGVYGVIRCTGLGALTLGCAGVFIFGTYYAFTTLLENTIDYAFSQIPTVTGFLQDA